MSDLSLPTQLLHNLTTLARHHVGELDWFADRMQDLPRIATQPHALPVCRLLPASAGAASDQTRDTVAALISAAPGLCWQQSYSEADGFSRDWLDNYGWVNLVSPEGMFHSDTIRVSIGYWGAGQHYDEHSHAPEEFYLILAGRARFHSKGRGSVDAGPGDIIHHLPHQKHAIDMVPGPLLAAAFWRGQDLLRKSDLGAR
ncbi:AraC family ligand binding domain-containing protein [Rhodobacteraceae bacterium M382]|nr:AraC family ligand binding domain-containing protein [Rhodobacteraceae bacterium M382]